MYLARCLARCRCPTGLAERKQPQNLPGDQGRLPGGDQVQAWLHRPRRGERLAKAVEGKYLTEIIGVSDVEETRPRAAIKSAS